MTMRARDSSNGAIKFFFLTTLSLGSSLTNYAMGRMGMRDDKKFSLLLFTLGTRLHLHIIESEEASKLLLRHLLSFKR